MTQTNLYLVPIKSPTYFFINPNFLLPMCKFISTLMRLYIHFQMGLNTTSNTKSIAVIHNKDLRQILHVHLTWEQFPRSYHVLDLGAIKNIEGIRIRDMK